MKQQRKKTMKMKTHTGWEIILRMKFRKNKKNNLNQQRMNPLLHSDMFPKMGIPGKKTIRQTFLLFVSCLLFFLPGRLMAWGFTAHKQINNAAVFTLPPELFKFYKAHI